ncbi:MAG: glycosyltransferase family 2 protein [Chloroflexi bacterium]|nr:glycosyltransferase family 2 protein [Chloroflexota bacterium]
MSQRTLERERDEPWGRHATPASRDTVRELLGEVGAEPGLRTDPRVVAVVPAFNEERSIGSVILKVLPHVDEVIVVDDGSADATADIAHRAGATVVRHEENQGKGVALQTGFRYAQERKADAVVTLDADGQHIPAEIPKVVRPVLDDEADIVVGSRYLEPASDVPLARIWGHRVFNFITNRSSGVSVTDSQSGFRAFSQHALENFRFSSSSFSVESEMQFLAHERGLRLTEVPIIIRYDDPPKRNVFVHGLIVLNGIMRLIGQHHPLLFFSLPGLIILLAGLGLGMFVVDRYTNYGQLAVGYGLITVLLLVVGHVSFFAGVILHSVRGLLLSLIPRGSQ